MQKAIAFLGNLDSSLSGVKGVRQGGLLRVCVLLIWTKVLKWSVNDVKSR